MYALPVKCNHPLLFIIFIETIIKMLGYFTTIVKKYMIIDINFCNSECSP